MFLVYIMEYHQCYICLCGGAMAYVLFMPHYQIGPILGFIAFICRALR